MRKISIAIIILLIVSIAVVFSSCGSKSEILPEPVSEAEQIPVSSAVEEPVAQESAPEAIVSSDEQQAEEVPEEGGPGAEESVLEDTYPEETSEEKDPALSFEGYDSVDLDLTVMSPTMIYSNVYNMMMTPEDYFDKVIKVEGLYAYYFDDETQKTYYAVVIPDATACCQQGVEFVLADETGYPDNAETVTVTGVLTFYEENGMKYLTLANAVLEIEEA